MTLTGDAAHEAWLTVFIFLSCTMTCGRPFSDNLYQVLVYMGTQHSLQEVIDITAVSQSTLYALYAEYKKNGHVLRTKSAIEVRGRKRIMSTEDAQVHSSCVIVSIVSDCLGVTVSDSTMWQTLHRKGFTMKQVCVWLLWAEVNADIRSWFSWLNLLLSVMKHTVQPSGLNLGDIVHPKTLSLLTKAHLIDIRKFGSGHGHWVDGKLKEKHFLCKGKGVYQFILLPYQPYGLQVFHASGVVYARNGVHKNYWRLLHHAVFLFIYECLLDRMDLDMEPGAHIIMDNTCIHHHKSITELIKGRGYKILYLPPYSPDFNPIEHAFSSIKAYVHRAGVLGHDSEDIDNTYAYIHLLEVGYSVTAESTQGWFHHCGYI